MKEELGSGRLRRGRMLLSRMAEGGIILEVGWRKEELGSGRLRRGRMFLSRKVEGGVILEGGRWS